MSHKGRQGRMSECSGATASGAVILEEAEGPGSSRGRGEGPVQDRGTIRCGVWPRQQTWLCVVPLLIGFIGLGLSLMLLKWIVVGTVRDYVPTDLVDANRIGQDPIFLSKPSGIPKGPDTTTTSTPTVDSGNPTPRTDTVTKGRARSTSSTTTLNSKVGGASGNQVTPRMPGNRRASGFTTTTVASRTTSAVREVTPSSSPPNPTVLNDSTQMWTTEHTTTGTTTLTTRAHAHRKTPSPTVPPVHSEHFKPCHQRDLSYCLNGGECFVIETLTGPHKHCKCGEGHQGIRCDQFLPKTDSILSDPNHLGIEFMENQEVYQRQVLSIISIAMAISLLGTVSMTLYCHNKRRREKFQAHLKENRSLKNYAANDCRVDAKKKNPSDVRQMNQGLEPPPHHRQGHAHNRQGHAHHHQAHADQSRVGNGIINATTTSSTTSSRTTDKKLRKSPDQRIRPSHWSASRQDPPTPRGRLAPIGGSRFSGPAYQHLQETEKDVEPGRGLDQWDASRQDAIVHMQTPVTVETSLPLPWGGSVEVGPPAPANHSRSSDSPPPFIHSCSIPIIPSILCHHGNEAACMQTTPTSTTTPTSRKEGERERAPLGGLLSSSCSPTVKQGEGQLWASANRKQEADLSVPPLEARETVCFLKLSGGSGSMLGVTGPTQTLLLSPRRPHRDLDLVSQ